MSRGLPGALCTVVVLSLVGCGADRLQSAPPPPADRSASSSDAGPKRPPILPNKPLVDLPKDPPVTGKLTDRQAATAGDYVPASVCLQPEFVTAVAGVLGQAPSGSRGGFLTDKAGETAWALEYAGAVSERDPSNTAPDAAEEARVLCWYQGALVLTGEEAAAMGSGVQATGHSVVSVPVNEAGEPLPVAPTAIFRGSTRLPLMAPMASKARTEVSARSRRAAPRDLPD